MKEENVWHSCLISILTSWLNKIKQLASWLVGRLWWNFQAKSTKDLLVQFLNRCSAFSRFLDLNPALGFGLIAGKNRNIQMHPLRLSGKPDQENSLRIYWNNRRHTITWSFFFLFFFFLMGSSGECTEFDLREWCPSFSRQMLRIAGKLCE